jgi:hypothetical protein
MNMPFELGIDHGCRSYFGNGRELKKILILEEEPCRYQAAISDLAGWDIMNHGGDYQVAVRQVRKWFVTETHVDAVGPSRILGAYADFQGWHYQQQLAKGWSEEDIQDYPTNELLGGMNEWTEKRRPL